MLLGASDPHCPPALGRMREKGRKSGRSKALQKGWLALSPAPTPLKFLETLPQPQQADGSGNLCRNAARAPWSGAEATPHNSLTSCFLGCIFECQAQNANDYKALWDSSIFQRQMSNWTGEKEQPPEATQQSNFISGLLCCKSAG